MATTCGVYAIRNKTNGKVYVGSSKKIEYRFTTHRRELRRGVHSNSHLQNAWLRYGEDSFVLEILEQCSAGDLDTREQHYIDEYHCLDRQCGYNISPKANLPPMTEETKRKIGLANRGKVPWNKNGQHSPETLMKMSDSAKKHNWMKGRGGPLHHMFGTTHDVETKEKMSRAKLGKLNNASSKPVKQFTPNGEMVYPSAKEAQRQTGIDAKNIAACLKGKRQRAGGCRWEYVYDETIS